MTRRFYFPNLNFHLALNTFESLRTFIQTEKINNKKNPEKKHYVTSCVISDNYTSTVKVDTFALPTIF